MLNRLQYFTFLRNSVSPPINFSFLYSYDRSCYKLTLNFFFSELCVMCICVCMSYKKLYFLWNIYFDISTNDNCQHVVRAVFYKEKYICVYVCVYILIEHASIVSFILMLIYCCVCVVCVCIFFCDFKSCDSDSLLSFHIIHFTILFIF